MKAAARRTEKIPKDKAYAFWGYDTFPYCLGGEVQEIKDDGYVLVKGYQSYKFKPKFFTTLAHGRELKERLDELKEQHREMRNILNEAFDARLKLLAPFALKK